MIEGDVITVKRVADGFIVKIEYGVPTLSTGREREFVSKDLNDLRERLNSLLRTSWVIAS